MDPLHWIRFLNFHPIWIQHPRVILYYQFFKNNYGTGRNFQSEESLNGEFLSSALDREKELQEVININAQNLWPKPKPNV